MMICRWPGWLAICCLLGTLWGCGGGEIDEEDELGAKGDEEADRYELVILEPPPADSTAVDSLAVPSGKGGAGEGSPDTQAAERPGTEEGRADEGSPDAQAAKKPGKEESGETPGIPVVFDPRGDFTVQIGHYQDARAAARMVRELEGEGYPVYAIPSPDGKGVRVRIGYFKTREDAQRFGRIFKADRKMEFWVDTRASEK